MNLQESLVISDFSHITFTGLKFVFPDNNNAN